MIMRNEELEEAMKEGGGGRKEGDLEKMKCRRTRWAGNEKVRKSKEMRGRKKKESKDEIADEIKKKGKQLKREKWR